MQNKISKKNQILKHKKNKVYLRLDKDGYKDYVVDVDKATRFNKKEAYNQIKRFKHPENWIVIEKAELGSKKLK